MAEMRGDDQTDWRETNVTFDRLRKNDYGPTIFRRKRRKAPRPYFCIFVKELLGCRGTAGISMATRYYHFVHIKLTTASYKIQDVDCILIMQSPQLHLEDNGNNTMESCDPRRNMMGNKIKMNRSKQHLILLVYTRHHSSS